MAVVTAIQIRRGTASQWTSANPTLASGEQGFETDTGKVKIGNGSTAWNSLAYLGAGTVTSITAGTGYGGTITTSGTIAIDTATTVDVSSAQTLTNKTLTDPKINLAFDAETASYTAVLANNGQVVTMNNASANTFSIPTNASVAISYWHSNKCVTNWRRTNNNSSSNKRNYIYSFNCCNCCCS
jgi:hypothetical protein